MLPPKAEERTFCGRLQRLLEISEEDGIDRYLRLISRCPSPLKQSLYGPRLLETEWPATVSFLEDHDPGPPKALIDRIMEVDLKTYLCDDILVKVDRASMAYGLEVRSPFLDPDVVELALALPDQWKQQGMTRKRILMDTFRDLLPEEVFSRRKMGFGVPIARWLRGDWRDQHSKEPQRVRWFGGLRVPRSTPPSSCACTPSATAAPRSFGGALPW